MCKGKCSNRQFVDKSEAFNRNGWTNSYDKNRTLFSRDPMNLAEDEENGLVFAPKAWAVYVTNASVVVQRS